MVAEGAAAVVLWGGNCVQSGPSPGRRKCIGNWRCRSPHPPREENPLQIMGLLQGVGGGSKIRKLRIPVFGDTFFPLRHPAPEECARGKFADLATPPPTPHLEKPIRIITL